ncbi:MAG: zinc finger domain-containing protein [Candidatus Micrarchaeia archaeon]
MNDSPGKICTSCGKLTKDYVEFKCPKCNEGVIIRCRECRENFRSYKCSVCGFEGP